MHIQEGKNSKFASLYFFQEKKIKINNKQSALKGRRTGHRGKKTFCDIFQSLNVCFIVFSFGRLDEREGEREK